jgi:hypothetical protein
MNAGKIVGIVLVVVLGLIRVVFKTDGCSSGSSTGIEVDLPPSAHEMCRMAEDAYLSGLAEEAGLPVVDLAAMQAHQRQLLRQVCPAAAMQARHCLAAGRDQELCARELMTQLFDDMARPAGATAIGEPYWHAELPGVPDTLAALPGHRALAQITLDDDKVLLGLDGRGQELWRVPHLASGGLFASHLADDQVTVVTTGEVMGVSLATGKPVWRATLPAAALWASEAGGGVYIGDDQILYALDLAAARTGRAPARRLMKLPTDTGALGEAVGQDRLAVASGHVLSLYSLGKPARKLAQVDLGADISNLSADGERLLVTTGSKLHVLAADAGLATVASVEPDVPEGMLDAVIHDDHVLSRRPYGLWHWKVGSHAGPDRIDFLARSTGTFQPDGHLWGFCGGGHEKLGLCRVTVDRRAVTAFARFDRDYGEDGDAGGVRVGDDTVLASVANHLVALPRPE